jgi:hypothetical protein
VIVIAPSPELSIWVNARHSWPPVVTVMVSTIVRLSSACPEPSTMSQSGGAWPACTKSIRVLFAGEAMAAACPLAVITPSSAVAARNAVMITTNPITRPSSISTAPSTNHRARGRRLGALAAYGVYGCCGGSLIGLLRRWRGPPVSGDQSGRRAARARGNGEPA